jgi:hypothetical protein
MDDYEYYRLSQQGWRDENGKCVHPECNGIHANNRYRELCPGALVRKRQRDLRYQHSAKGQATRGQWIASNPAKVMLRGVRSNAARRGWARIKDQ